MPRKAFVADLSEAIKTSRENHVYDLKQGDDDGTFTFKHRVLGGDSPEVTVQALVPDVSEYPSSHQYFVYTTSENVPRSVNSALGDPSIFEGMKVGPMLLKVAKLLDNAVAGSQKNPVNLDDGPMDVDEHEEEEVEDWEAEGEELDDTVSEEDWSPRSSQHIPHATRTPRGQPMDMSAVSALNSRIREDLRVVKKAGFRVGHIGGLLNNARDFFITVSCRIAKLGISEEAMQAWHLDRSQYIVFLVHYTAGYRPLDRLIAEEAYYGRGSVHMRVGVSQKYKITLTQAIHAFSQVKDMDKKEKEQANQEDTKLETPEVPEQEGLHGLFIGRPLDELLNKRLVSLLRYRTVMGFPWGGAEEFYNDNQGHNLAETDTIDHNYWNEEKINSLLPHLVTADHLTETSKNPSFPLLGMQFLLRHLVRCTEFCLVCHCKVEADFEALKPYVCSKPLCLYQYMALGFGPSIEYEILSQPCVVDLLISFCYASASNTRLKSFPTGMGLMVPPPAKKASWAPGHIGDWVTSQFLAPAPAEVHKASFDRRSRDIILAADETPLKIGDWVRLHMPGHAEDGQHCRVMETYYPRVRLGSPIVPSGPDISNAGLQQNIVGPPRPHSLTPAATPPPPSSVESSQYPELGFGIYDQHFDDLDDISKQQTICTLLDTLPSVRQMGEYLQANKELLLRTWMERISPAALGVLRWIIASNRSCIVQVDSINVDGDICNSEERVYGMHQWMQFRFAQGAPDKEQRFIESVREASERLSLRFPTIFAWHGSPLSNWHGIVREGLHFQDTLHGRAYGNGVYHSLYGGTSLEYSSEHNVSNVVPNGAAACTWPQSRLAISQAIALDEIVNAPNEFVSRTPHLVIAQLNWIQTRYLFVKCNMATQKVVVEREPTKIFEQDPAYTPIGVDGKKIVIPIKAVSKSRRPPQAEGIKTGHKKIKLANSDPGTETLLSDDTEAEDIEIFLSDSDDLSSSALSMTIAGKGKGPLDPSTKKAPAAPKTDFVPGTLDHSTLPLIQAPSYATTPASKTLQRELAASLKIQNTLPSHELGWYINPELVNNVYQWIVELHSFEPHLPLAKDMKARDLQSVVLEIRFGKDYPISPPFVRVIRPRFLTFLAGGGGHVTAGGALCMELLTNSGWSAVNNIESVLLQVRLAISSTEPRPARLEPGAARDYGVGEAVDAFVRACQAHGWEVPKDFYAFSASSESSMLTGQSASWLAQRGS
ncbi:MAG: hypothetical protein FRX48_01292 [Lasallia pustulata]|uniref:UBC core domain-containing protein n=1 Tax=Lasallia pustulata TaxID=136370 RepID=A0A5M8PXW5_9LECA|nr:MAG: hypothetical protein FRX48_01292 [Lasallia pustulata]